MSLAEEFRLPLIATNGVQYASERERPLLDVFTCIRNHTHLDAAGRLLAPNAERYLKTAEQMRRLFADCPEAIENTSRLAAQIDFTLKDLGYELPDFPLPDGETLDSFLRQQAYHGAKERYAGELSSKVRTQLE